MTQEHASLVVVVKRQCPTCLLVVPVLKELQQSDRHIEIYCQDDNSFHDDIDMILDDRNLEQSFLHDIEYVPTLIRKEHGHETGRVFGWNRKEWVLLTGIKALGEGLPKNQPGCGSKSVEPGILEKLQARYKEVPIRSRKVELSQWDDPIEQAYYKSLMSW